MKPYLVSVAPAVCLYCIYGVMTYSVDFAAGEDICYPGTCHNATKCYSNLWIPMWEKCNEQQHACNNACSKANSNPTNVLTSLRTCFAACAAIDTTCIDQANAACNLCCSSAATAAAPSGLLCAAEFPGAGVASWGRRFLLTSAAPNEGTKMSEEGINVLKNKNEGIVTCESKPPLTTCAVACTGTDVCSYYDQGHQLTIGWGHLVTPQDSFTISSRISMAQAQGILDADLSNVEKIVNKALTLQLPQAQLDKLYDFCYNAGCSSGPSLDAVMAFNNPRVATEGCTEDNGCEGALWSALMESGLSRREPLSDIRDYFRVLRYEQAFAKLTGRLPPGELDDNGICYGTDHKGKVLQGTCTIVTADMKDKGQIIGIKPLKKPTIVNGCLVPAKGDMPLMALPPITTPMKDGCPLRRDPVCWVPCTKLPATTSSANNNNNAVTPVCSQ